MPQNVNRIQDAAVANVNEIAPKDWHKFPPPIAASNPAYVRSLAYSGGVYGDDVDTANATLKYEPALGEASSYTPQDQADKAAQLGTTLAVDITQPRGYIGPRDPYGTPVPPAPTITSLAPNTAVAGSPSPLAVVVTGTGFTQWTTLETGGVPSPYAKYVSPTKMTILMDPARSTPGIVVVKVIDHGVKSVGTNFTYT